MKHKAREPHTVSDPCLPAEGLGKLIIPQRAEHTFQTASGCTGGFQANREAKLTGPALQTLTISELAQAIQTLKLAQSYRAGDRRLMETSELEAQDKGLGYLQNQIALFKDKMSAGLNSCHLQITNKPVTIINKEILENWWRKYPDSSLPQLCKGPLKVLELCSQPKSQLIRMIKWQREMCREVWGLEKLEKFQKDHLLSFLPWKHLFFSFSWCSRMS